MPSDPLPFVAVAGGVRVAVRLSPGSSRDGFDGLRPTAGEGVELCARVTAAPERGRANKALIGLMAKAWKVPKRDISIAVGETDRHKQVLVAGSPPDLLQKMTEWLRSEVK